MVVAYWLLEQSWRPVVINAPRAVLTRYCIDFPPDSPWYRIKEMPQSQGNAAEDRWREMAMIQHFGFDSPVFELLFLSFARRWEDQRPSSHMGRARLCDGRDALAIALSHIRVGGEAEPHQLIFGLPPSTFSDYLLPALRALHSVCADEPLCAIKWMFDADRKPIHEADYVPPCRLRSGACTPCRDSGGSFALGSQPTACAA